MEEKERRVLAETSLCLNSKCERRRPWWRGPEERDKDP